MQARNLVETIVNIIYIATVWIGAYLLITTKASYIAYFLGIAFFVLGSGDVFHIGFRVLINYSPKAVKTGDMVTSFTFTFYYMFLVEVWRIHTGEPMQPWQYLCYALLLLRIFFMLLPQNKFAMDKIDHLSGEAYTFAVLRNVLLAIPALITASHFVTYAGTSADLLLLHSLGNSVILAFVFYLPVILFAHRVPALGMLMLPTTFMYMLMVYQVYNHVK